MAEAEQSGQMILANLNNPGGRRMSSRRSSGSSVNHPRARYGNRLSYSYAGHPVRSSIEAVQRSSHRAPAHPFERSENASIVPQADAHLMGGREIVPEESSRSLAADSGHRPYDLDSEEEGE